MKKLFMLLVIFSLAISKVTIAEEVSDIKTQENDVIKDSIVKSEEEIAYEEYFNTAYVMVRAARNVCISTENFLFWINYEFYCPESSKIDYSFLTEISSPLEMNEEQLGYVSTYINEVEGGLVEQHHSDTIRQLTSAITFDNIVASMCELYNALPKPTVPQKYNYIDSLLGIALDEAENYANAAKNQFSAERSSLNPSYDETAYDALTTIYELIN